MGSGESKQQHHHHQRASGTSSSSSSSSNGSSSSSSSQSISQRDRAKAAIIGAFVADSASMGLHLIYDQAAIEKLIKDRAAIDATGGGPEFFDPPESAFYDYHSGRQSPYGDEMMVLLRSISSKGYFDPSDAIEEWSSFYQAYDGRLNRVSQRFIELKSRGISIDQCAQTDDTSFESAAKIPIIVARYAGSPMMLEKLDDAVKVHQTNEKVLHATRLAAKLLEKVILGSSIPDALLWASTSNQTSPEEKELLQCIDDKGLNENLPFSIAAETFGLSGQLPGCLRSSIYALKCFRGYEVAIRANIVAGGDNACRGWILGSMLAAECGDKCIPEQWKSKTLLYAQIVTFANRIAGSNPCFENHKERSCWVGRPSS